MRIPAVITIASDQKVSAAADLGPDNYFYGIEMPAAWTAGNITFKVANDKIDGTYSDLIDDGGSVVTLTTPAAGQTVLFRTTILDALKMFHFVKLVSQNNQAGDRTLYCLVRSSN